MKKIHPSVFTMTILAILLVFAFKGASFVSAQACTGSIKCDTWNGPGGCGAPIYNVSCQLKGCGAECTKPKCHVGGFCSGVGGGTPDCGNSSALSCQGADVGDACGNGGKCQNPPNCSCQGQGGAPTPTPTPSPSPSCSVTLSPDPASISVSSTQVFTASVVPADGTVSQVDFLSNNTSFVTVSPASDTTSPYETTGTGVAEGSTTVRAGVIMDGAERCFDSASVTVTSSGPWWQVQDADILTLGNLISLIPSAAATEFILDGAGGFPGVAVYGGITADFDAGSGSGTPSSTGWLANASTTSQRIYDYDYFESLIPGDVIFNEITSPSIAGSTFTSGGVTSRGYYWYRFDGTTGSTQNQDLTITSSADVGSRKVILLVKGADLNLGGDINLTDGAGFFMALSGENESGGKGNISVSSSVGASAIDLEGFYLADNVFRTGAGSEQLYVRGSVAAYGGIILERDLADNSTTPAEFFEYAPDQILLYPSNLGTRRIRWKEVAP